MAPFITILNSKVGANGKYAVASGWCKPLTQRRQLQSGCRHKEGWECLRARGSWFWAPPGAALPRLRYCSLRAPRLSSPTLPHCIRCRRQSALPCKDMNIRLVTGSHPPALLQGTDLIVKNPGISPNIEFLAAARAMNIKWISELELAWLVTEAELVAVTGTQRQDNHHGVAG